MDQSDTWLGASYINTMTYSVVYVTTAPMTRRDFSPMQLRFAPDGAFGDYQRAEMLQAYRSTALYARRFLDAYLKNDASAPAFLKQSPARHGIGPRTMSMKFHAASATLLGEGDFLRAFSKADYSNARSIYTADPRSCRHRRHQWQRGSPILPPPHVRV